MSTTNNIFGNPISMKDLVRKVKELKITGSDPLGGSSCGDPFVGNKINLFRKNQNPPFTLAGTHAQ